MPSIFQQATEFRRALLARDKAAAVELVRAYGEVYRRIQARVSELTTEIAGARTRGEEITPAWLAQRDRLASLLRQVEAEVSHFSFVAQGVVSSSQLQAVGLAQAHAEGLLAEAGAHAAMFSRLPTGAVEEIVGFLSDGSPLREMLTDLAPQAVNQVRQSLITGVALGQSPARIAAEVRSALGGNLTRSLTLSRTATINAYRSSTLKIYRENSDIISGWQWLCAKSPRTCLACVARDGTVWPLDEYMPAHWNCRCSILPIVRGAKAQARESGAEWFERQTEETQRGMMGAGGFEMFKRGEVTLADFVGMRRDKRLGKVSYVRSLKEVRETGRRAA